MSRMLTALWVPVTVVCLVFAPPVRADEAKAKRLAEFLPKPLAGYEMAPPVTRVVAEGDGKGNYAIGTYTKAADSLTIRIFDAVAPMTLEAVDKPADFGAKPVSVKGQKGILREAPSGAGSASIVVEGRITVEVNWTSALKADWTGYVEAIDYRALAGAK